MNKKDKIAWLERYQDTLLLEQSILCDIETIRSGGEKVTASLSGMPSGCGADKVQDSVVRLVEVCDKLTSTLDRIRKIYEEIKECISYVEDNRLRAVLDLRYIKGYTFQRIGEILGYDIRHVFRLHDDAIEKLVIS